MNKLSNVIDNHLNPLKGTHASDYLNKKINFITKKPFEKIKVGDSVKVIGEKNIYKVIKRIIKKGKCDSAVLLDIKTNIKRENDIGIAYLEKIKKTI